MRRIKLTIAYDGTHYHGWQKLTEGDDTIEGKLGAAIRSLIPDETPELIGASRTDAGVHARGNVAVFDTLSTIPAPNFTPALNRYLPEDIRIIASEEVPEAFHPRFQPHTKIYEYRIDNNRVPDPLKRLYCYNFSFPLDLYAMQRAAGYLIGVHDFRSFVNPDSQVFQRGGDAVREIYHIDICRISPEEGAFEPNASAGQMVNAAGDRQKPDAGCATSPELSGGELRIRISGNGFLYHMIRIIAGTLLEVGTGKRKPEDIPDILSQRDRRAAGRTAPAKGLTLVKLVYQDTPLPHV